MTEYEGPTTSESDDRGMDPAKPRTLATLTRLARMKGYPDPKPGLLEHEARTAIGWLGRLQPGDDGRAKRQPAVADVEVPGETLRGWFTKRP